MIRILFLDLKISTLTSFDPKQVRFTTEDSLGCTDTLNPTPIFFEKLRSIGTEEFDGVVIGNNMGAGFGKVQALSKGLRARSIVVYNGTLTDQSRMRYEALGCKEFKPRDEFWISLEKLFKQGVPQRA